MDLEKKKITEKRGWGPSSSIKWFQQDQNQDQDILAKRNSAASSWKSVSKIGKKSSLHPRKVTKNMTIVTPKVTRNNQSTP